MTTPEQTPADEAPITIQPATADALAFVLSKWGRLVEKRLEATPQPGFLKAFAPIQARIIKRSQVLTAMKDGRIVGFVVFEPGVLHWIYVREEHRRKGIGRRLIDAAELAAADASPDDMPLTRIINPVITFWTSDLRHLGIADAPFTPFWLRT
jgi:GNAT superfamily N-acetyltransferase